MAKQFGLVLLQGSLGDTTFVRTKNGFRAQRKTSLNRNRIANDPNYEGLRNHMAEFVRASKAGKLVRQHFQLLIQHCKDGNMHRRLTGLLVQAIKMDSTHPMGLRNLQDGKLSLLENFEFNINSSFASALSAGYTTSFDRASGEAKIMINPFIPDRSLKAPGNATHYRISAAAAAIDFETQSTEKGMAEGSWLPITHTACAAQTFTISLPAALTVPVLLAMKLEFCQEVNGVMNDLEDTRFNACCLVKVDILAKS
ncbi:MAG: hypothetical protein ABIS69_04215 [Sediminibacterium sp.]